MFAAEDERPGRKELKLLSESDTPIRRHIKIRADANPYDKKWELYFEAFEASKRQNLLESQNKRTVSNLSQKRNRVPRGAFVEA